MALVLKLNPKEIIKIVTTSGEVITVQAPDGDNSNQKLVFKANKEIQITRCLKLTAVKVKEEMVTHV